MYIITKKEADKIISSKDGQIRLSLDLGLSFTEAAKKDNIVFIDAHINTQDNKNKHDNKEKNMQIPVDEFKNLKEHFLYVIDENDETNINTQKMNAPKKIAFFSEDTNIYYKLLPTSDWPTLTLSSTPMHRHIHVSPKKDTELKIREINPVKGIVLDTCCGLGYTAIMSSHHAKNVHTFERDANVLHIAGFNPHSRELFANSKIIIHKEDVLLGIKKFEDNYFDRVIHDPPTFTIAPQLYSALFHKELYRVLKKGGILYHYCPAPGKTKGKLFYPKIIRNLQEAGFKKAVYSEKTSGIKAVK